MEVLILGGIHVHVLQERVIHGFYFYKLFPIGVYRVNLYDEGFLAVVGFNQKSG